MFKSLFYLTLFGLSRAQDLTIPTAPVPTSASNIDPLPTDTSSVSTIFSNPFGSGTPSSDLPSLSSTILSNPSGSSPSTTLTPSSGISSSAESGTSTSTSSETSETAESDSDGAFYVALKSDGVVVGVIAGIIGLTL